MKIGYFITHFPCDQCMNKRYAEQYVCGGAEVVAYNLAINMAQRGHKIRIFTTSVDSKDSKEKYRNMYVYRYGKTLKIESANVSFKLFTKPLKYDVDIVHTHCGNLPAPIAALLYAKIKKIPLVVTYHGDKQENYGGLIRRLSVSFFNKILLSKILSYAKVIISPSYHLASESKFLTKYTDKITIIPNGIQLSEFSVPYSKREAREKLGLLNTDSIILFVGSLVQWKNPHVLLKTIPLIKKVIPSTKLILLGGGPMLNELRELSEKLRINNDVKFIGYVARARTSLYYRATDIFVLPSFSEGFPLVLLEASAFGLPLVVSNLKSFKAIVIDGYNGLFTETGNKKDLANKIIYLLKNQEIRERVGRNAAAKVKEFSLEKVTEETEQIYSKIINDRK